MLTMDEMVDIEIIAKHPRQCEFCDVRFVPGMSKIYDTGHRGARGGKLMAHVGCTYEESPYRSLELTTL
jgi:hypothetical protein